jgi:tetratricopeptide (TPR) repeat protein
VLALLLMSVPAARAELPRDEARLAEVGTLLGDRGRWDEAIAAYREIAASDPSWSAPRHQLARVLAWRGDYDESLALYDALLAEPDPPADAQVERAEVLSWAGRLEPARAAFEALLERRPGDPRAARGMARVHRWSGDRARADRWYARALAAEDDAEAREEWRTLRAELARAATVRGRAFRDSDDFQYLRSEARFEYDLDFDTRLRLSTAATRASVDEWAAGAPLAGDAEDDLGLDARLAVERRLAPRWKGVLELGGRAWQHGDARPLARAGLEYSPDERTALGLELRHDDLLERSFSLASVLRGIGDTTLAATSWRQVAPGWETWTGVEASLFTDGNGQASLAGSIAWKPWRERQVLFGLAAGGGSYRDPSAYYYSPELDASGTVSVQGRLPIRGALELAFDLGGGLGYAREQEESGFGPAYRAKAGLSWRRGGFTASLDVARSQSQRSSVYTTHELQLALGYGF